MPIIGLLHQVVLATLTLATVISTSQSAMADISVLHDGTRKEGTILIHSEIRKGDLAAFARAADNIRNITRITVNNVPHIIVDLDTLGGDVMEAVQIGRLVRDRFMFTRVLPGRIMCQRVLIHPNRRRHPLGGRRCAYGTPSPKFDSTYFAGLTADNARRKYNVLIDELRKYFLDVGASEEAFRIMLSTPSDRVRYLTIAELESLGFRGNDPAWDELTDATFVERYGAPRWRLIKPCVQTSGDLRECERKAYERYPQN
jgi:hypothetical protein